MRGIIGIFLGNYWDFLEGIFGDFGGKKKVVGDLGGKIGGSGQGLGGKKSGEFRGGGEMGNSKENFPPKFPNFP